MMRSMLLFALAATVLLLPACDDGDGAEVFSRRDAGTCTDQLEIEGFSCSDCYRYEACRMPCPDGYGLVRFDRDGHQVMGCVIPYTSIQECRAAQQCSCLGSADAVGCPAGPVMQWSDGKPLSQEWHAVGSPARQDYAIWDEAGNLTKACSVTDGVVTATIAGTCP